MVQFYNTMIQSDEMFMQGPAEIHDDLAKQFRVEPLAWGICP